jgi:hypothetical protein
MPKEKKIPNTWETTSHDQHAISQGVSYHAKKNADKMASRR